ncbi:MAG: hypothetical protein WCA50_18385, partial [Candidatus Sulfotelmatobacter sp.]
MPLFTAKCDDSVRIVGQPEVGQKRASGKRARSVPLSPRAVSEAPPERRVGMRDAVQGRFGYSDLKEAAPRDYGIC